MAFGNSARPTHNPFMPIPADFLNIIISVTNVATPSVTVSGWNDEIPVAMSPGAGLIFDSVVE